MGISLSNSVIGLVFYFLIIIPIWEITQFLIPTPWIAFLVLVVEVVTTLWIVELPARLANWYQLKFEMITQAEYESNMKSLYWKRG